MILPSFIEFLKGFLINAIVILMISRKLATPDLPKVTVFCEKGYGITIDVYYGNNKMQPPDSNYLVNVLCHQNLISPAFPWKKLS